MDISNYISGDKHSYDLFCLKNFKNFDVCSMKCLKEYVEKIE